jgi:hypothetical protein
MKRLSIKKFAAAIGIREYGNRVTKLIPKYTPIMISAIKNILKLLIVFIHLQLLSLLLILFL